jgi:membrane-bound lytic murein transglycosylase D
MRHHNSRFLLLIGLSFGVAMAAEKPAPKASTTGKAAAAQAPAKGQVDSDALYDLGRELFDQYASPDLKKEYDFPTREEWKYFLPKLKKALEGNSLEDLAALESDTRAAVKVLERMPEGEPLAIWLRERLELIEAARDLSKPQASTPKPGVKPGPAPKPSPGQPTRPPSRPGTAASGNIPALDYWVARIQRTPAPAGATAVLPIMKRSFANERMPTQLVWLAEVESTFKAEAASPSGAKGYFQFMPETAKHYGLSTFMPDERSKPDRSAEAAARYLKALYREFNDWPLAIAAYNAGGGRVRRLLKEKGARSFAEIATALPVETRLYVPKVLATVQVRTGTTPGALARPGS